MTNAFERMQHEIFSFPELLEKGVNDSDRYAIEISDVKQITWVGMGASALVGEYISAYFSVLRQFEGIDAPIIHVTRSHVVPKETQLVVLYSYSGETTETLLAASGVLSRTRKVICLSRGGMLEELAKRVGVPHVKLVSGYQSRSHLPYGLSLALCLLARLCGLEKRVKNEVLSTAKLLRERFQTVLEWAESVARSWANHLPMVVAPDVLYPVLTRARTQLSENPKLLSITAPLPEALHNVFSALPHLITPLCGIVIDTKIDECYECYLEAARRLLSKYASFVASIELEWKCSIEPYLAATFYIDVLSLKLAEVRRVNPLKIPIVREVRELMRTRLRSRMTLPSPEHTHQSHAP